MRRSSYIVPGILALMPDVLPLVDNVVRWRYIDNGGLFGRDHPGLLETRIRRGCPAEGPLFTGTGWSYPDTETGRCGKGIARAGQRRWCGIARPWWWEGPGEPILLGPTGEIYRIIITFLGSCCNGMRTKNGGINNGSYASVRGLSVWALNLTPKLQIDRKGTGMSSTYARIYVHSF